MSQPPPQFPPPSPQQPQPGQPQPGQPQPGQPQQQPPQHPPQQPWGQQPYGQQPTPGWQGGGPGGPGGPGWHAPPPTPRRRTGLWIGLGLGALAIIVVISVVIALVVTGSDDDKTADDKNDKEGSSETDAGESGGSETAPPEPGLLSYHPVVGEVEAGAEPSSPENLVITDPDSGATWELGPAVIDETDVRDAHPEAYPELGEDIWVVKLTLTDEAHDEFITYIRGIACADSAPDNQLAFIIEGELGYAGDVQVPCDSDADSDPVLNGYYDEDEARALADQLEAAGEDG